MATKDELEEKANIRVYGTSAVQIGWWDDPAGAGRKPLYGKYIDGGGFAANFWKTIPSGEPDVEKIWPDIGASYMTMKAGPNVQLFGMPAWPASMSSDATGQNVLIYTSDANVLSGTQSVFVYVRFIRTGDAWQ